MHRPLRDHIQSWVSCGIQYLVMLHGDICARLGSGDICARRFLSGTSMNAVLSIRESIAEIRHISQVPRTLIYLAFVAAFALYQ